MKIAEIRTIPKHKKTEFMQSPARLAPLKFDSVSFGRAQETPDSLKADSFYANHIPVHKKTIAIHSSAQFGDVTADESLWVERHLTADNVTSPKVTVGSDARIARTLKTQNLHINGALEAGSLDAEEACIMGKATIAETTKAEKLRAGYLQTKNLIATEASIAGNGLITGDAQVEHLISYNGSLEVFGNTNAGRITTYSKKVSLGEVSQLGSVVFANDPDTYWEFPQRHLRFTSPKLPERISVVLDRGVKLFVDSFDFKFIDKLDFFEYNPSGEKGYKGKPITGRALAKRVQFEGQESVSWFTEFSKRFAGLFKRFTKSAKVA